jgi:hypothetical protein
MASNYQSVGNKRGYSNMCDVGGGKRKRITVRPSFKFPKATILSDSICQKFLNCMNVEVQCVHGGTMDRLASYIQNGSFELSPYMALVISFGSNDLTSDINPPDCANAIVRSLDRAIVMIRQLRPDMILGVSGIIPRKIDESNLPMREVRCYTNVAMRIFCDTTGLSYYTSENFMFGKKVDPEIPLYRLDGIHLTLQGAWHLQNYLEGKVGNLLGPSPVLHAPPTLLPSPEKKPAAASGKLDN